MDGVSGATGLAAAGAAVAFLVIVVARSLVNRRALRRRLEALAVRLADRAAGDDLTGPGVEDLLLQLERLIDLAQERVAEAEGASLRMRHALDTVDRGVIVADDRGQVVHRNDALRQLTSVAASAADGTLVEHTVEELLGGAAVDAIPGRGVHPHRTVTVPGPVPRTLTARAVPIDDGRRSLGTVVAVEDVSDRQRLADLQHDLVADAREELGLPVASVRVLSELLLAEAVSPTTRRLASRIHAEALAMSRTLEDLLMLYRADREGATHRHPVPMDAVVGHVMAEAEALAEEHHVRVEVDQPAAGAAVIGDRRQLTAAVAHLVRNAVESSAEGGVVVVTTRATEGEVEVSVRDQGPGIPASELGRVFDRFYRLRRHDGGAGLGLAIARQVAASHGGEVCVSSTEGSGSTFVLRLPLVSRLPARETVVGSAAASA